jgi:anti-anti-sigma regulatory factor
MEEGQTEVGVMIIEMDGTFDVPAAQRVALALQEAGEREVRIDLTHVRDFHDFGVALLAKAMAGRRQVSVRGLRTHQVRLMRYLGIDAETQPSSAA